MLSTFSLLLILSSWTRSPYPIPPDVLPLQETLFYTDEPSDANPLCTDDGIQTVPALRRTEVPSPERVYANLPSELEEYLFQSVPCTPDQLHCFTRNRESGLHALQQALTSEDPGEQYQAIRLAGDLRLESLQPELEALARNTLSDSALRAAACHALKFMTLEAEVSASLLDIAEKSDDPLLSRSALVALASSSLSHRIDRLEQLLHHEDSLIRTYAWRLWSKHTEELSFEGLAQALENDNPFVRREGYAALADCKAPQALTVLKTRLSEETDDNTLTMGLCDLQALQIRLEGQEKSLSKLVVEKASSPLFSEQHWAYNQLMADPSLLPWVMSQSSLLPHNWGPWLRAFMAAFFAAPAEEECEEGLFQKHNVPVHYEHSDFILSRYAELNTDFPLTEENRRIFLLANSAEDNGIRPINHAYNPLTGRGFLMRKHGFGGSALKYCRRIQQEMKGQSDKRLWASAGRILHVLQDMTSPQHVYGIWHPFNTSLHENYWTDYQEEVAPLLLSVLPEILQPSETAERENWHLDPFTRSRLQKRIEGLETSIGNYIESLAWHCYYSTSYWGALSFAEEAIEETLPPLTFTDGTTPESDNSLARVLDGNIHYRCSWHGQYFVATDRKGREFFWNKCFLLDGFRPCSNSCGQGSVDGHRWFNKDLTASGRTSVAGRFVFLQRGFFAKHCYPAFYPDGWPMEDHLSRYHGNMLIPACLRYGLGLLDEFYKEFLFPVQGESEQMAKASPLPYRSDVTDAASPGSSSSTVRPNLTPPCESTGFHESGQWNFYRNGQSFLERLGQSLALFSGGCHPFP